MEMINVNGDLSIYVTFSERFLILDGYISAFVIVLKEEKHLQTPERTPANGVTRASLRAPRRGKIGICV